MGYVGLPSFKHSLTSFPCTTFQIGQWITKYTLAFSYRSKLGTKPLFEQTFLITKLQENSQLQMLV